VSDVEEHFHELGHRQAIRGVLGYCIRELGDEARTEHGWRVERADAVNALRRICEDFGDNDWDESLNLADVIEKHLEPYLEREGK
jgi:hypothetical protein